MFLTNSPDAIGMERDCKFRHAGHIYNIKNLIPFKNQSLALFRLI